MTYTVTVEELKAELQKYVDEARRGNTVQIKAGEETVAELNPPPTMRFIRPDPWLPLGTIKLEKVGPLPVDGVELLLEERRKDRER